jgi:hypothetical protein
MRSANWMTKTGAVFYALWGLVHVIGGAMQLATLKSGGGAALTAMVATASGVDPATLEVPVAAAAFMGMGAMNILWIGALVLGVAAGQNWQNIRAGYWLNLALAGATDTTLLLALLLPGIMAWSDGMVGIGLFLLAAAFSTAGGGHRDQGA